MAVISILLNLILGFVMAGLTFTGGFFFAYFADSEIGDPALFITAAVFHFVLFLFEIFYAVVSVSGSILGFMGEDSLKKRGLKLLVFINAFSILLIVTNLIMFIVEFSSAQSSALIPASFDVIVFVCQSVLLGYGIFHSSMIFSGLLDEPIEPIK